MLLTWNEERNIASCLASLARQTRTDFEVVVVDAASTDGTVDLVRQAQRHLPVPIRLEVAPRRLPIGEARNLGVSLSRAPRVAFLSADAEADERWVEETMTSLEGHDMVFARQVHAPHRWTVGAAVRGLRYHFPKGATTDPLRFASNVGAGYRREILQAFPFDPWANAAEDLLLARRAHAAGYRGVYNPDMVVLHHDVATSRDEMRKSIREGLGWGVYHGELGLFLPVLGWGLALVAAGAMIAWRPGPVTLGLLAALLWLPAVRRAFRRIRAMPVLPLIMGVLASPIFDLLFLFNYLRGLLTRGGRRPTKPGAKEANA